MSSCSDIRGGSRSPEGADLPEGVERDFPLARQTTIRTGGSADFFARVGDLKQLERILSWADAVGLAVGVIGSGSNLLVADSGVRGLVIKLDGALARIKREDRRLVCGGGARLPQVSARAAALGLGGLEFGVNIPGTVGGAVKMNANAYGGELQRVLEWVDVSAAAGTDRRRPPQLGFAYRRSNLGPGEVVALASFVLEPGEVSSIKAVLADMRARRRTAQPSGIKTFGSTFKNPDDSRAEGMTAGQLLEAADCSGLVLGGARFSPKHANFIENRGDATTADVLALMAEGRRRVRERFGVSLEPEVQLVGAPELPPDLWTSEGPSKGAIGQ
jgi:UDP-N-acetylenolpyruvoylglucosamine reductase